ncbi:MAG: NAD(P)-dependent alcohol dehydrogenase [Candidatus Atribacteria bacterium]|nr:NAD(P)-dependent alcohol dehydrogenase [Candidatus Atribacteria bacterium]MCD6349214.1 NAD(P)-dependent alcohol dehydrogenase [Candidatus Atribacteria bacterium]
MKAKAVYLEKVREFKIREIDVPEPGPGEVLIRVKAVGICGSDVHYYEHGRIGKFVVESPIILGHEAAGEVVQVGEGVTSLKVGDRVAMEPGVPCRKCKYCKTGRYNLCPEVKFWATPPIDGAFREYVVHPADFCFKLPSNVSFEEGAMFEPLAVGLWAVEKANPRPENSVAILGVGTIGMMTLQSVKAVGVSNITVFDVSPHKLNIAEEIGAKVVLCKKDDTLKMYDEYKDSFDVVFETAGSSITASQSVKLVAPGGTIVYVGLPPEDAVPINLNLLISKEVTVKTVFRYANMYPRALELVSKGKIKLSQLISKRFHLEQLQEAFEYTIQNKDKVIKTMIVI